MSEMLPKAKIAGALAGLVALELAFAGATGHGISVNDIAPGHDVTKPVHDTLETSFGTNKTLEFSPFRAALFIDETPVKVSSNMTITYEKDSSKYTYTTPQETEDFTYATGFDADVSFDNLACLGGQLIAGATVTIHGSRIKTRAESTVVSLGTSSELYDDTVTLDNVIDCKTTSAKELAQLTELTIFDTSYAVTN